MLYAADVQTNGDKSETRRLGHRYTVQEAAEILGTTVDGVRSRIRRGSLNSMKVSGTVYVLLDTDQAGLSGTRLDQSETSPDEDGTGPLIEAKEETIAELRDQVAYLREQLGQEREANRENRRIIAGLIERLPPQLEPPRDEPGASETDAEASGGTDTPEAPTSPQTGAQGTQGTARRPWWLRLLGG